MHSAFSFELHCVSQPKADIARMRTALRMCGFVHFATAGEGVGSGHTVISAHQAEEHHVSQRTAELWNVLGWNGPPIVIWFNMKLKSGPAQTKSLRDLSR